MEDNKQIVSINDSPTEEEVEETIREIKGEHNVLLNHTDAIEFTKLTELLRWWLTVEQESEKPGTFDQRLLEQVIDTASGLKKISPKSPPEKLKLYLEYAIAVSKKSILKRMKNILDKY